VFKYNRLLGTNAPILLLEATHETAVNKADELGHVYNVDISYEYFNSYVGDVALLAKFHKVPFHDTDAPDVIELALVTADQDAPSVLVYDTYDPPAPDATAVFPFHSNALHVVLSPMLTADHEPDPFAVVLE